MWTWTDPENLSEYRKAKKCPGLYVIGKPRQRGSVPVPTQESDPYLMINWPKNFLPVYVGISESSNPGVRGRLSCHARSKGNLHIKELLAASDELYFIAVYGKEFVEYEVLFTALKTGPQFAGNVRLEYDRAAKRMFKNIREEMGDEEYEFYDELDVEEDGM